MCMCILHIVFCTVCKYVLSICKLFCFSALSGARSQEFHSPRHLCCGDVTIKVIWFDLIWFDLTSRRRRCGPRWTPRSWTRTRSRAARFSVAGVRCSARSSCGCRSDRSARSAPSSSSSSSAGSSLHLSGGGAAEGGFWCLFSNTSSSDSSGEASRVYSSISFSISFSSVWTRRSAPR